MTPIPSTHGSPVIGASQSQTSTTCLANVNPRQASPQQDAAAVNESSTPPKFQTQGDPTEANDARQPDGESTPLSRHASIWTPQCQTVPRRYQNVTAKTETNATTTTVAQRVADAEDKIALAAQTSRVAAPISDDGDGNTYAEAPANRQPMSTTTTDGQDATDEQNTDDSRNTTGTDALTTQTSRVSAPVSDNGDDSTYVEAPANRQPMAVTTADATDATKKNSPTNPAIPPAPTPAHAHTPTRT